MKIFFAADHAGFELKEKLKLLVQSNGHDVVDVGAHEYVEGDDYVEYCAMLARLLHDDPENERGIVLGGSGQGEAIVVNRFAHVRAVVWNGESDGARRHNLDEVHLSREHNNSNVFSIGARFVNSMEASEAVLSWLVTPFSAQERHVRRLAHLKALGGLGHN